MGTSYEVRVVATATGYINSAEAVVGFSTLGVPGSPLSLEVISFVASASVSWEEPLLNGGSAVTTYVVTLTDGVSGAETVQSISAASTEIVLDGLISGRNYTVSVVAINAIGSGVATSAEFAVGAPSAPEALMIFAGDTTLRVTWRVPATDNGRAITGYMIRWRAAGIAEQAVAVNVDDREYTLINLANGNVYTVSVNAINTRGGGIRAVITGTPRFSDVHLRVRVFLEGALQ